MAVILAHLTFDCIDPPVLASFWSAVLGRPVDEGASPFFASIDRPVECPTDQSSARPSWFFIKVPEHKSVKNRLHVDVTADDREVEVARLMGLGGSRASDHDEWGAVWTVMADPEGNEFCVGQRPAEA